MARIKIEPLPRDVELTVEEMQALYGAGRPRFRPALETLEERANPGSGTAYNGATSGSLPYRAYTDPREQAMQVQIRTLEVQLKVIGAPGKVAVSALGTAPPAGTGNVGAGGTGTATTAAAIREQIRGLQRAIAQMPQNRWWW